MLGRKENSMKTISSLIRLQKIIHCKLIVLEQLGLYSNKILNVMQITVKLVVYNAYSILLKRFILTLRI